MALRLTFHLCPDTAPVAPITSQLRHSKWNKERTLCCRELSRCEIACGPRENDAGVKEGYTHVCPHSRPHSTCEKVTEVRF